MRSKMVSGRIDHMAVDLRRQRLFMAELGNGAIDIIDLTTGKTAYRIDGIAICTQPNPSLSNITITCTK